MINFPLHLLGPKRGLLEILIIFLSVNLKSDHEQTNYKLLPAGETNTPSETSFLIICFDPCLIDKDAACLLCP